MTIRPSVTMHFNCCFVWSDNYKSTHLPQNVMAVYIRYMAVIVYGALCGTAPQYLSDRLQYVADLPTRRRGRLRSSTSSLLDVRPSRRVTVGDRSFAAAGLRLWYSLPADVQSAPSLATFRQYGSNFNNYDVIAPECSLPNSVK